MNRASDIFECRCAKDIDETNIYNTSLEWIGVSINAPI